MLHRSSIKDFPRMLNSFNFHFSLTLSQLHYKINLSSVPIKIFCALLNYISYRIIMMIILLYSAAILIETILLVNYLRLRLVEIRLPEPCSSLVKHLNIFHGDINNKSFKRNDTLFKRSLTVLFLSIKQKHDSQNSLVWFASLKLTD